MTPQDRYTLLVAGETLQLKVGNDIYLYKFINGFIHCLSSVSTDWVLTDHLFDDVNDEYTIYKEPIWEDNLPCIYQSM